MAQERLTPQEVAQIHATSDNDSGPLAQHHTLGTEPGQSSPGNHTHDGRESKLLYQPRVSITGSRGGNVALQNLLTVLHNHKIIQDDTVA